jgi:hypothetical protein
MAQLLTGVDAHDSRRESVCERVTQPIRLALPDLFQDRLAKLTTDSLGTYSMDHSTELTPPLDQCGNFFTARRALKTTTFG